MRGTTVVVSLFLTLAASASNSQGITNVDEQRTKLLNDITESQIPNPEDITKLARATFALPLSEQSEDILKQIATKANLYANFVGFISGEYDSYRRENFRYDFVVRPVEKAREPYIELSNKFKDFRNQAYFNMGLKARDAGKNLEALLYFRDAFRLSDFECGKEGSKNCARWHAEIEIQKLLRINGIRPYVTWQKKKE
jgi:hypothetical protein